MKSVRPSLKWTLGAVAALSVIALARLPPSSPTVEVAQSRSAPPVSQWQRDATQPTSARVRTGATLPARIEREAIAAAERDPFGHVPPPAPAPVQQPPPILAVAPPPPIPMPVAPALTHRLLGSMRNPDGRLIVYITDGPGHVEAQAGVTLSSGYVIESMSEHEIRLVYPALAYETHIAIPPPPTP